MEMKRTGRIMIRVFAFAAIL
ncbi:MAG: hypothetical protein H6Q80_1300, partial [Deltaproteobacteria bacterium]|nr:hypothetical protein [Deltaproteobacteria bacterium]